MKKYSTGIASKGKMKKRKNKRRNKNKKKLFDRSTEMLDRWN